MGIWDTISDTTDSLKRNAPDLTAAVRSWCPTTDSLKRTAPDVIAAKNVCSTAYGYGSAAVTKVDGAVRGNLIPYVRNEVAWSKIAPLGPIVAKHAINEALKLVPGGSAVFNVGARSFSDFNNSNKQEVDVKALQAKLLRLEKEVSKYREMKPCADLKSLSIASVHSTARQKPEDMESEYAYRSNIHSVGTSKPEDVIRVFIMKEFVFRQLCDDIITAAPRKRTISSTRADNMEQ